MAATTPSPSGRRHLKTLSLSSSPSTSRMSHTSLNQSPSSASAASAAASVGAAASPGPPATSTSTSTSHNPLRLSLRSSTSSSTRDDAILEDAPWTAPMPDTDSHQTSTNSSSSFPTRHTRTSSDRKSLNRLSLSSDISSASSSRSALRSSWGSSQLDQGPGPDSPSSLAAKKANRRQSSISYTRDPSTFTAAPWSAGSTATSASSPLHQHVQASPSPLASHRSSLDNTPASAAGDVPEGPQTPSKATGATLVEQHADLLSFIAKKERKCLDLREELKRHEDELKGLKKKWETIVARDQLQPSGNTSSSASSPNISRSPLPATAAATPPSASPSLPSGAFDGLPPSSSIPGGSSFASASRSRSSSEDNNGPDVAAATKRWMGGWMKQGMAGVSGIIEGMAEPRSSSDGSLGTVREEEEDESHHGRPPVPRKDQHHRKDDILVKVDEHDDQQQPDLRSSQDSGMSAEGPPSANKDFKTLLDKQNRRKSAFDMGSWGDALKTSKKAALGFVETFERTLADSLVLPPGEDSPGGTSPRSPRSPTTLAGSDLLFDPSSATTLSPGSPRPHSSRSRTPSPRHSPGLRKSSPQQSFNWDAALDESSGDISAEPLQQQQQQQPQSQNGRLNMAREKRAKRQTSPASGSAFAAFKDDPKEETDGWGW